MSVFYNSVALALQDARPAEFKEYTDLIVEELSSDLKAVSGGFLYAYQIGPTVFVNQFPLLNICFGVDIIQAINTALYEQRADISKKYQLAMDDWNATIQQGKVQRHQAAYCSLRALDIQASGAGLKTDIHAFQKAAQALHCGVLLTWEAIGVLLIPSATRPGVVHRVDADGCSCEWGQKGKPGICWHQAVYEAVQKTQEGL